MTGSGNRRDKRCFTLKARHTRMLKIANPEMRAAQSDILRKALTVDSRRKIDTASQAVAMPSSDYRW
jgi:hypothetical protein